MQEMESMSKDDERWLNIGGKIMTLILSWCTYLRASPARLQWDLILTKHQEIATTSAGHPMNLTGS